MYYLITIQNKTTANIIGYADEAAALSKFYTEMSYGVSALDSIMCQLIGDAGNIIKHDFWQKNKEENVTAVVSDAKPSETSGSSSN